MSTGHAREWSECHNWRKSKRFKGKLICVHRTSVRFMAAWANINISIRNYISVAHKSKLAYQMYSRTYRRTHRTRFHLTYIFHENQKKTTPCLMHTETYTHTDIDVCDNHNNRMLCTHARSYLIFDVENLLSRARSSQSHRLLSLHFCDDLPSLSRRTSIANAVPHAISSLYSQSIIYAPPNIWRSLQNHWHEKSTFCPAALSMLDILLFAQTSANSQRFTTTACIRTRYFSLTFSYGRIISSRLLSSEHRMPFSICCSCRSYRKANKIKLQMRSVICTTSAALFCSAHTSSPSRAHKQKIERRFLSRAMACFRYIRAISCPIRLVRSQRFSSQTKFSDVCGNHTEFFHLFS